MASLDDDIKALLPERPLSFYKDLKRYEPYLSSGNRMIMNRLGYNDHGITHAKIVTRNALRIFDILKHAVPLSVVHDLDMTEEDSMIVIIASSFLHDIGNMVHRDYHNVHSVSLAIPILHELLPRYYEGYVPIMSEILHGIFAHDETARCLTTEAGIVSIADGTDMEEGRGRIPYERGRIDIHSASAMAIRNVHICQGEKPLRIEVSLTDNAGIFQVQEILGKKLLTTGLREYVEIYIEKDGKNRKMDV
jgi:hypothetical protein